MINKDLIAIERRKKNCSKCGREILTGQHYAKSVIDGSVTCSTCDTGVLVKGDLLFFPD